MKIKNPPSSVLLNFLMILVHYVIQWYKGLRQLFIAEVYPSVCLPLRQALSWSHLQSTCTLIFYYKYHLKTDPTNPRTKQQCSKVLCDCSVWYGSRHYLKCFALSSCFSYVCLWYSIDVSDGGEENMGAQIHRSNCFVVPGEYNYAAGSMRSRWRCKFRTVGSSWQE